MGIIERHREILERTPDALDGLLRDLPDHWTRVNEGDETWSPFDVLGHLVHGEHSDWIPRIQRLLDHGEEKAFDPFDRLAQNEESKGKSINQLLDEFRESRNVSLTTLSRFSLVDEDLDRPGTHPDFGSVQLGQLLATWVAHDLVHLSQITRVMARQYRDEVGPWRGYIRLLNT